MRFLAAYRENPVIARLARVHRATVYRWQADPAFVAAMEAAVDDFYRNHRAKVAAWMAERRAWRQQRERERHPRRCENLAKARAAMRSRAGR